MELYGSLAYLDHKRKSPHQLESLVDNIER